ncbi:MAG TPA: glycosyl hydrolase family 79 C-terminal domain-containing protein [Solirubrobacteraceae bacterium]|nr:glycosyl hydrolase family 79 C-terminal domain-containing protein [Solirubrobacteraceae bacterium]
MPARRGSADRRYLPWLLPLLAVLVAVAALAERGGATARAHGRNPHPARRAGTGRVSARSPRTVAAAVRRPAITVRATVLRTPGEPLPRSFLGLSFEYWDLPSFASHPAALQRVFRLLRIQGDGPVPLRIGGDSADQSFWGNSPAARLGPWPYHITDGWLRTLASVVRTGRLRVLLDLNLAQRSPAASARFARQAVMRLPAGSLMGFEIGNEPDIYHHWVDYHLPGRSGLFAAPSGWDQYSPARYARAFSAYARALARVAPRVPLAGPETAYPQRDLAWERRLLSTDAGRVAIITVHRYPLSACARPSAGDYSTIARVLSPGIAAGLEPGISPALALARRAGLPLRMTELNSVTCEGRRGVSNTFAAALWAPDALFSLWKAGLAGVNIHVRQGAANAAFWMSRAGLKPRPLLYGLALFARAVGSGGRLAHLRVGRSAPSIALWAARHGQRLNVLVLDKGASPARLVLRVPSERPAVIERLSAPSVHAATGVTLAGQTLGASGRWLGRRSVERVRRGPAGYRLDVPPYSGALISFGL